MRLVVFDVAWQKQNQQLRARIIASFLNIICAGGIKSGHVIALKRKWNCNCIINSGYGKRWVNKIGRVGEMIHYRWTIKKGELAKHSKRREWKVKLHRQKFERFNPLLSLHILHTALTTTIDTFTGQNSHNKTINIKIHEFWIFIGSTFMKTKTNDSPKWSILCYRILLLHIQKCPQNTESTLN